MSRVDVRKTYKLLSKATSPARSPGAPSPSRPPRESSWRMRCVRLVRTCATRSSPPVRPPTWAGSTAYNRGQVLYRVAEMMESRRADLIDEVGSAEGRRAPKQVDESIDTFVWYAGFTDKLAQIAGGLNQVAGPYFNLTAPEATGVVGIVPPRNRSLAGLAGRLAPVLCGGNAAVVICSERYPLPAIALAECLQPRTSRRAS